MGENLSLRILAPAQRELADIAQKHMKLVGPVSARKITNRILDTLNRLCVHPRMGVAFSERELRLQGFRMLICGKYLCFYRQIGETVCVYHIVDGRSHYPRISADLAGEDSSTEE